ncbi:GntR family transcriptional regulator [Streptomyces sp. 846.5]|nr:GntR family transcriptional regulator [Streptomyces sp. 846.5]TDU03411.1 GntR family transcriptional regulator [Streptomyces sp. 846.5]
MAEALFRQIAESLRAAILSGELTSGTQLPSENELKDRYGTTRVTVRKAIALLKADGLLVSHQSKGVFVRPRPAVQMLTTGANFRLRRATGAPNYSAEAAAQGRTAVQQLLGVDQMVSAAPEVAERFQVPDGTPMVVRRLLYVVDGEPMQLVDSYYLASRFAGAAVAEPKRVKGGVSALIEDPEGPIQQRIVQFVENLEMRMPTPQEAVVLAIPPGVPLARVFRTMHVASGEIVEVLDSRVAPAENPSVQLRDL